MAESGRRRLRLVGGREAVAPFPRRVRARGQAVGIADVAPEGGALAWSVDLAEALCGHTPVAFVACSFGEVPEVSRATLSRLEAAGASVLRCAIEVHEQGFAPVFDELGDKADGLWVCVGEPAVALLQPALAVLVGTEAGLSQWPPSLRPYANHAALCLSVPRRTLALALAEALVRRGAGG